MNYYGQQIPNSGLISLDELHLQMLVRVLGTGARRKLSFRKIDTILHDLVVQLAAGLVHSFGPAGGSIPSASCGGVFPLVGQQDFFFRVWNCGVARHSRILGRSHDSLSRPEGQHDRVIFFLMADVICLVSRHSPLVFASGLH